MQSARGRRGGTHAGAEWRDRQLLCGGGIYFLQVGAGRHGIVLGLGEQVLVAAVPGLPQQVLPVALLVETLVPQMAVIENIH